MHSYFIFWFRPERRETYRFPAEEAETSAVKASGVYVPDGLGLLATSLITGAGLLAPDYLAAF
jgi:hypothetical protein